MKKNSSILAFVAILALVAMSCNLQAGLSNGPQPQVPPQSPQPIGPQPGGPQPQNPQPGGPSGQEPQPGGPPAGQPGEAQILSFDSPRTSINSGECTTLEWNVQGGFLVNLNGEQVERSGQKQVCPPTTTTYRLGVDTGNQMIQREIMINVAGGSQQQQSPTQSSPTKKSSGSSSASSNPTATMIQMFIAKWDLAVDNIYPSATGHIMVTIKNAGNMTFNTTITLTCSGTSYTPKILPVINTLGPTSQSISFNLKAGDKFDQDTTFSRNPDISKMFVTCSITPPSGDSNKANDSKGPVQVK